MSPPNRPRVRRRPLAPALLSLLALLPLSGCAALRPTPAPLRTVSVHDADPARCLVVLLPGRHSRPEAFAGGGFGAAVAERRLAADVVAVDAHLGYYRKRTVVDRLYADVLAPARGRYEQVWVVGTSLGGLGGLLVLRDHPDAVDGVLAIAPYLGEDELIEEIRAAGGPRAWQPAQPLPAGDAGRELWNVLRGVDWKEASPLYLGWGRSDSLAPSNEMLGGLLPEDHVFTDPGGHDMATWNALWEQFLDRVTPCGDPAAQHEAPASGS